MAERALQNSPNLGTSKPQEDNEKQQETILLELKMILETVKNIDRNIIKSIELLQDPTSVNLYKNNKQTQIDLNHNGLIEKNIETISDILRMLDSLWSCTAIYLCICGVITFQLLSRVMFKITSRFDWRWNMMMLLW